MNVLSSFVLALHLACMNLFAAGPLVCAWLDRKRFDSDPPTRAANQRLAWLSCIAMLVGAALGVVIGWLRWDDEYRHTLMHFSYRLHWGMIEFAFSGILTVAYAIWLRARPTASKGERLARTFVALMSATNLLYHFPPLFTLVGAAAGGELEITNHVDSATFRHLVQRGDVLALTAHFTLASFAVTGLALAILGRDRDDTGLLNKSVRIGSRFALIATVCQIPVGLWLVVKLPTEAQRGLMGEDPITAAVFVAAILATFWLLHQLAALAFGNARQNKIWQAIMSLAAVVFLMSIVLERGRMIR